MKEVPIFKNIKNTALLFVSFDATHVLSEDRGFSALCTFFSSAHVFFSSVHYFSSVQFFVVLKCSCVTVVLSSRWLETVTR